MVRVDNIYRSVYLYRCVYVYIDAQDWGPKSQPSLAEDHEDGEEKVEQIRGKRPKRTGTVTVLSRIGVC